MLYCTVKLYSKGKEDISTGNTEKLEPLRGVGYLQTDRQLIIGLPEHTDTAALSLWLSFDRMVLYRSASWSCDFSSAPGLLWLC